YALQDVYQGDGFFDNFNFFSAADPTHGFVKYLNHSEAVTHGLINTSSGVAVFGADGFNTIYDNSGRSSIRIESKKSYTHGLFIADISHMPGSLCGIWPAFWTLGSGEWPGNGEIDIIEGVNLNEVNAFTLHTSDVCIMNNTRETGTLETDNCAVSYSTTGCTGKASGNNTYGDGFNDIKGGVYAMQWTSQFIKIWFFPRDSIPDSISRGAPEVSEFGTPQANFHGSCDIDEHFKKHRIVFDTTFCGDFAGSVYHQSTCPQVEGMDSMGSCIDYVKNNPSDYLDAFWSVNYIKVYEE
ncbi:glycoside hydrolase family 16 protein, partial [Rhizodiscina lignyota]